MIINVDSTNNKKAQFDIETGLVYYSIIIYEFQKIIEIYSYTISKEKIVNDNLLLITRITLIFI